MPLHVSHLGGPRRPKAATAAPPTVPLRDDRASIVAQQMLAMVHCARTVLSMRRLLLLAAAAGTLAVAGVVAFVSTDSRSPYPTAASEVVIAELSAADLEAVEDCMARRADVVSLCIKDLLVAAAKQGRYGAALSILDYAAGRDSGTLAGCHGFSHTLGQTMYSQGMPLPEVMKIGWFNCRLGLVHGAMELFGHDLTKEEVPDVVSTTCATLVELNMEAGTDCSHLLGHIISDYYNTDMAEAFALCEYAEEVESACVNGVVMRYSENLEKANSDDATQSDRDLAARIWGSTKQSQEQRLRTVCDTLFDLEMFTTCVGSLPQVARIVLDNDWAAMHEMCASFDERSSHACFEGIAGAVMLVEGWQLDSVIDACSAGVGAGPCLGDAAFSYAAAAPEGDADTVICAKVPSQHQAVCRQRFADGARWANRMNEGGQELSAQN